MKPMKKVTDPHSIRASDIPSISEANPAGVICATGLLDDDDDEEAAAAAEIASGD